MKHVLGLTSNVVLALLGLVALSPIPPPTARGQEAIANAKLAEKPIDILGGHLTVRMPRGAKSEARPVDIMSAPQSEEHETRVLFDDGPSRLALMAHEYFAFAGDDFEKQVREVVAKWRGKYKIEPRPLPGKGLKAVAVIPQQDPDHTRSDDSAFLEGIFVESGDRTVQSVDLYINAAGEKNLNAWKTVAHEVLLSVAQGKKALQLAAGERRLRGLSDDWDLAVNVPKNFVATLQVGPDFFVHRLMAVGPFGSESESILIYMGDHPSYEPGPKARDGMLFGKRIEWHSSRDGERKRLETLCKVPIPGEHEPFAHVIIWPLDDGQLTALREMAESLKVVKPRTDPRKVGRPQEHDTRKAP